MKIHQLRLAQPVVAAGSEPSARMRHTGRSTVATSGRTRLRRRPSSAQNSSRASAANCTLSRIRSAASLRSDCGGQSPRTSPDTRPWSPRPRRDQIIIVQPADHLRRLDQQLADHSASRRSSARGAPTRSPARRPAPDSPVRPAPWRLGCVDSPNCLLICLSVQFNDANRLPSENAAAAPIGTRRTRLSPAPGLGQ